MVQRSGVASSTLRYYEKLGLIASEREGSSEHRRYRESTFQKIRYITIGQRAGFSLEEIAAQLATLPDRFPVLKKTGSRCPGYGTSASISASPNSSS